MGPQKYFIRNTIFLKLSVFHIHVVELHLSCCYYGHKSERNLLLINNTYITDNVDELSLNT